MPHDAHPPAARLGDILPLRVLSADDIATNRVAINFICRGLGYPTDLAESAPQVLERLAQQTYDLVLLDIEMPAMSGLDLAREICRRAPDPARRPKLVAITATMELRPAEKYLAAGFDAYLNKPLFADMLRRCIWRLFRKRFPRAAPPAAARTTGTSLPPWFDDTPLRQLAETLSEPEAHAIFVEMRANLEHDLATARRRLAELSAERRAAETADLLHGVKGGVLALGWVRMGRWCNDELVALRAGKSINWETLPARFDEYFQVSIQAMAKGFLRDCP